MDTNDEIPQTSIQDSLGIFVTEQVRHNLTVSAQWGKIMSIAGFAGLAFTLFKILKMFSYAGSAYMFGSLFSVIIVGVVSFFVNFYLYRYATKMLAALSQQNQQVLDDSFAELKAYFRLIGILFVLSLVLGFGAYFFFRF